MITRSANRKPESLLGNHQDTKQQTGRKNDKNNVTNANEQPIIHTELQSPFQTPVLNIHIHLPPHKEGNLQSYLPKIQPVIHFHFNELERKFEFNSQRSFTDIQNFLQASPKIGDVTFHYSNKSMENSNTGSEIDKAIPCSSKNSPSDDSKSCSVRENNEKSISENKEISDGYESNYSSENVKTTPKSNLEDPLMSELYKKYKLKEAVLVLRDVCKTNYSKNKAAVSNCKMHQKNKNNGGENSYSTLDQVVEKSEEGNGIVAPEELSKDPKSQQESSCSESGEREIASNASINTSNDISLPEPQKIGSDSSNTLPVGYPSIRNLSALAEGCDFSEILNRFRFSQSKGFINDDKRDFYSAKSNQICTVEAVTQTTEECKNDFNNRNQAEKMSTQQNFYQSNIIQTASKDIQIDLLIDVRNDAEASVAIYTNGLAHEGTASGDPSRDSFDSDSNGSEQHRDRTEMGRKRPNKTDVDQLKKKACQTQATSSPSKKKRPNELNKKSGDKSQKSTKMEEYIPLQVSGPTQFVVAPLNNKVNPYKAHDARNFKTEMLFGKNRVKRFPSSDNLRIYQMKRASRNRSA